MARALFFLTSLFALGAAPCLCFAQDKTARAGGFLELLPEDFLTLPASAVQERCSGMLANREKLGVAVVADLLKSRGTAYYSMHNLDAAKSDFEEWCRLCPKQAAAHYWLGMALRAQNHLDEAAAASEKAIALDRSFAPGWVTMAVIRYQQGRLADSMDAANKALDLDASLPEGYYTRSWLFWIKGDYKRCLNDLDRYLQLDPLPKASHPYYRRGQALLALNRTREALRSFLMERGFFPSWPEAARDVAIAYQTLGNWPLTLEAAENYQKLSPNSPTGFLLAAMASSHLGDDPSALRQVEQALARAAKADAGTVAVAGNVYAALGKDKSASDCFDRALSINPACIAALAGKADLMAACPNASYRNGPAALRLALKAHAMPGLPVPERWYTGMIVAEAYAECGQFDQAVKFINAALQLAGPSFADRTAYLSRLRLFEKKIPYRYTRAGIVTPRIVVPLSQTHPRRKIEKERKKK